MNRKTASVKHNANQTKSFCEKSRQQVRVGIKKEKESVIKQI